MRLELERAEGFMMDTWLSLAEWNFINTRKVLDAKVIQCVR
jgi:hypothetical protein